jgi:hypothetical protein
MPGRIDLDERLERLPGPLELAVVVERPAERLEDGALPRLEAGRPLEHDGSLRMVAPLDERLAPLEELVRALRLSFHRPMVARIPGPPARGA